MMKKWTEDKLRALLDAPDANPQVRWKRVQAWPSISQK